MPYSSTSDLPGHIKERLSPKKQKQWLATFNSIYERTKSEGRAFAGANAAVKKVLGWENTTFSVTIRNNSDRRSTLTAPLRTAKANPSTSSVHVPNADDKLRARKESDGFTPPESAKNAAKRVLRWKEKYGNEVKGMTSVGWNRARQLAAGGSISLETVKRMAQFARHKKNSKIDPEHRGTPWRDAGYVAWQGWGGDAGIAWAQRVSDRETKKSLEKASGARTLYACRPLLNAEAVIEHYKAQGIATTLLPDDMHVTVAYSRDPIRWDNIDIGYQDNVRIQGGPRGHQTLGGEAFTLCFDAPEIVNDWLHFRLNGAGYDYPAYQPHVTLTYSAPEQDIEPYTGPLIFGSVKMSEANPPEVIAEKRQLGDDQFTTVQEARAASYSFGMSGTAHVFDTEDGAFYMPGESHEEYLEAKARMAGIEPEDDEEDSDVDDRLERTVRTIMETLMSKSFTIHADVVKAEQQIAYGWASVVSVDGENIIDKQGHVITSAEMEKMANAFMMSQRVAKEMHTGSSVGEVIHSMPITSQLMKALGGESKIEGWLIGVKINDPDVWKRVKDGTLKAFSIGGKGKLTDLETGD